MRQLVEHLNNLLFEEMCVNDDVTDNTKLLAKEIKERTFNNLNNFKWNENGYKIIQNDFKYNFISRYNTDISVTINVSSICYCFKNKVCYDNFCILNNIDKIELNSNSSFRKVRNKTFVLLNINFVVIGQDIDVKFYDDLQHEVNHIYQQLKIGRTYNKTDLYANNINNLFSNDKYEKIVSWLVYVSDKTEQDSAVNGLYALFNDYDNINDAFDVDNIIINSTASKWLKTGYEYLSFIKQNKDDKRLQEIINKHCSKSISFFIKDVRNGLRRFENKIVKTIYKIKKDFWGDSIRFKLPTLENIVKNKIPIFYDTFRIRTIC